MTGHCVMPNMFCKENLDLALIWDIIVTLVTYLSIFTESHEAFTL